MIWRKPPTEDVQVEADEAGVQAGADVRVDSDDAIKTEKAAAVGGNSDDELEYIDQAGAAAAQGTAPIGRGRGGKHKRDEIYDVDDLSRSAEAAMHKCMRS